jgi:hypothetical protein
LSELSDWIHIHAGAKRREGTVDVRHLPRSLYLAELSQRIGTALSIWTVRGSGCAHVSTSGKGISGEQRWEKLPFVSTYTERSGFEMNEQWDGLKDNLERWSH